MDMKPYRDGRDGVISTPTSGSTREEENMVFKEEHSLFRYCEGNLNFSTAVQEEEDFLHNKKKIIRDPMSHRIIEKRRRDRMNNCLADLSRLIPADYLKKGRGRVEKTEIIEMAIKHMRHLQSIIASSNRHQAPAATSARLSGDAVDTGSGSAASSRESAPAGRQPIVVEHYRLGYLECLSEAMHFLVEVQGFFAGDSLCVEMISHLHKHCDKILKGDTLNFPRQRNGETTSSNSSSSTSNYNSNYNNTSPPLGMSNSTGSNSDDNRQDGGQFYQAFEASFSRGIDHPDYHSPAERYDFTDRRFLDPCKRDAFLSGYLETGASEGQRSYSKEDSYDSRPSRPRDYSTSSGIESHTEDTVTVKDESVDGPSQLREMLTSPKSAQSSTGQAPPGRHAPHPAEVRRVRTASPESHTSGCETSSSVHLSPIENTHQAEALNYKTHNTDGPPDNFTSADFEGNGRYKFKNNIKQRFSKESGVNEKRSLDLMESTDQPEDQELEEFTLKKVKLNEDISGVRQRGGCYYYEQVKCPDPLMKERLSLLHRHHQSAEVLRGAAPQDKDQPRMSEMPSRLGFGHKSSDKKKRWEEPAYAPHPILSHRSKLAAMAQAPEQGKPTFPPQETGLGIPIFALHTKGSFYIPLTLDQGTLLPFLPLLGVTKSDEPEQKTVLHPVTISVNFQSQQAIFSQPCLTYPEPHRIPKVE